jgi:ABC transporter substrate binding protein
MSAIWSLLGVKRTSWKWAETVVIAPTAKSDPSRPGLLDQSRRAAGYFDRILRGEKPNELPVQTPTRYELAINLKTAKALGLKVSDSLLARVDNIAD